MGLISQLAAGKSRTPLADREESRARWRRAFGTDKETPPTPTRYDRENSIQSTRNAFELLLKAMRSKSPGGWSDDRWEQSKHFVGIQYVAIHRICQQLQQGEFQVFVEDEHHPDGKRPVTKDDPSQGDRRCRPYDLVELLKRPNGQDSFGKLMYRWGQQKRLTGTALTWVVPNMFGVPFELYSVPTALAIPQPVINPEYPHGFYRLQPVYPYGPFSTYPTPNAAVGAAIPAEWMMRFQYPHPYLRYDGYSPLTGLRLHIDEVESIDRSRFYGVKRTFRPNVVLQMGDAEGSQPLPDAEIERIRAEIENAFMGPENVGNLFVSMPGSRLEEFGTRPVDMDYQAGWDQLTSFILGGGFGITKPAAGMVEDSSYSTLFATLKQLYMVTLDPDCEDISSDLTMQLAHYFGDNLIVHVRCKRIDDHEVKQRMIDTLIRAKAITKNECRRVFKDLDLKPVEGDWGEEIAGSEPQPEPGAEGGMPGMEMPGEVPGAPEQGGEEVTVDALLGEPEGEIENTRPDAGPLSQGALGPRKSLREAISRMRKNGTPYLNGSNHA